MLPCTGSAFLDEKVLKGAESYSAKGRPDPLTGCWPVSVVSADFRNTYPAIGLRTISWMKSSAFLFNLG